MKNSALNARLLCAAELTRQDATFADIGTDHAYLPLFLLDSGKIKFAYCCDINEGPLASARKNAEERARLDKTEFILTDGATVLSGKGITDYAICGMGGELIADIIERAPHLKDGSLNLILQPMSSIEELRYYLAEDGFEITDESICHAQGKLYQCINCSYTGNQYNLTPAEATLGKLNIEKGTSNPYFKALLSKHSEQTKHIILGKQKGGSDASKEKMLLSELESIENKLEVFNENF